MRKFKFGWLTIPLIVLVLVAWVYFNTTSTFKPSQSDIRVYQMDANEKQFAATFPDLFFLIWSEGENGGVKSVALYEYSAIESKKIIGGIYKLDGGNSLLSPLIGWRVSHTGAMTIHVEMNNVYANDEAYSLVIDDIIEIGDSDFFSRSEGNFKRVNIDETAFDEAIAMLPNYEE